MSTEGTITIQFTEDEAWELLSRCLNSTEPDSEVSREALGKLAAALKHARPKLRIA